MTSHTCTELGLEPWVGDSRGTVLLTIPAASLTLDEVVNDLRQRVIQVLRKQRTLVFSGRLWGTQISQKGHLGKSLQGWIGFGR